MNSCNSTTNRTSNLVDSAIFDHFSHDSIPLIKGNPEPKIPSFSSKDATEKTSKNIKERACKPLKIALSYLKNIFNRFTSFLKGSQKKYIIDSANLHNENSSSTCANLYGEEGTNRLKNVEIANMIAKTGNLNLLNTSKEKTKKSAARGFFKKFIGPHKQSVDIVEKPMKNNEPELIKYNTNE